MRAALGSAIITVVYYLTRLIPAYDNASKYFFLYMFPALLFSVFIYGIWPVICLKIGLVKVE